MITKELLEYVRMELTKGLSQDQITSALVVSGGWQSSDIEEAFHALGSSPVTSPMSSVPVAPIVAQPVQSQSSERTLFATNTPFVEKKSFKYGVIGSIVLVLGIGLGYFSFLTSVPANLMGKAILFLLITAFFPVLILEFLTIIFKITSRTWGKALFIVSVPTSVLLLINILLNVFVGAGLGSAIGIVVIICSIIAWLLIFSKVYSVGWGKAFIIGFLQISIVSIVSIIMIFSIGLSFLFSAAHSIQNTVDSSVNVTDTDTNTTHTTTEIPNQTTTQSSIPSSSVPVVVDDKTSCTQNTSPWLKVTSPLSGTFKLDQPMTLTWNSCNIAKNVKIGVQFASVDGETIASQTRNDDGLNTGTTTVTPSSFFFEPGVYNVGIWEEIEPRTTTIEDSTDFSINFVK